MTSDELTPLDHGWEPPPENAEGRPQGTALAASAAQRGSVSVLSASCTYVAQLARRARAALRMTALDDGCRDPLRSRAGEPILGRGPCDGRCRSFGLPEREHFARTLGVCPCAGGDRS